MLVNQNFILNHKVSLALTKTYETNILKKNTTETRVLIDFHACVWTLVKQQEVEMKKNVFYNAMVMV